MPWWCKYLFSVNWILFVWAQCCLIETRNKTKINMSLTFWLLFLQFVIKYGVQLAVQYIYRTRCCAVRKRYWFDQESSGIDIKIHKIYIKIWFDCIRCISINSHCFLTWKYFLIPPLLFKTTFDFIKWWSKSVNGLTALLNVTNAWTGWLRRLLCSRWWALLKGVNK